ncbi:MAG: shikimate kinase, partial [Burkholderiaceae bacterium]|nr:shikimate kinase [Burkholderiaceae bacterium]
MGAGKSTVGKLIARKLERRFIDSDHALEERCGVKIPTIFEMEGEAGFRKREAQIIDELTREHSIVLATGGGAILLPDNRRVLAERGT